MPALLLLGFPLYPAGEPDIPPPPPPPPEEETPCSYPACGQLLLTSFSERPESRVLRTEMESGPPKQRRVRARAMRTRTVTYLYTAEKYAGFKGWIDVTEGDWFGWTDPVDGQQKLGRIVSAPGQAPYEAKPYVVSEGAPLSWEVSMQIETWG